MMKFRLALLTLAGAACSLSSFGLSEAELGLPAGQLLRLEAQYKQAFARNDFYGMAVATHRLTAVGLQNPVLARPRKDIVVLVPNQSFADALGGYVAEREALGFDVRMHNLEAELGTSRYTPHDIRALLQAHYRTGGLRYLILVGDEDLVPLLPAYASYGYDVTYTDYYYDTDALVLGNLAIPLGPEHTVQERSLPEVWNAQPYSMVYNISHGNDDGTTLFDRDEISNLHLQFPAYFVAAACSTSRPIPGWNFSEALLFEGGCAGAIGSSNIVHPGEGLRLASGVFAEIAFALAAVQPNQSLGSSLHATRVIYYQLFVKNETDPYWLEIMGQNLKGYQFYGDPEVPLRTYRSLFEGY